MTAGERREEIQARKTASDDDKRALKKLNGHDLAKLHKETVRKMNRREEIRQALHGRSEVRAIEVGKILAKIQVQRDSGGVRKSATSFSAQWTASRYGALYGKPSKIAVPSLPMAACQQKCCG